MTNFAGDGDDRRQAEKGKKKGSADGSVFEGEGEASRRSSTCLGEPLRQLRAQTREYGAGERRAATDGEAAAWQLLAGVL